MSTMGGGGLARFGASGLDGWTEQEPSHSGQGKSAVSESHLPLKRETVNPDSAVLGPQHAHAIRHGASPADLGR